MHGQKNVKKSLAVYCEITDGAMPTEKEIFVDSFITTAAT